MNIQTIDFAQPDIGENFVRSLQGTGFAVLRNHPVAKQHLDTLYKDWGAFFNSDRKNDFLYDPDNYDGTQQGFHPQHVSETAVGHAHRDLKEFYHFIPGCNNPPELVDETQLYRRLAFELGGKLLAWIQQYSPAGIATKFSKPLPDMLCSKASLLRILHYPPLSGSEGAGAVRAAAHEDINMITILPVAKQPGLQVQDNAGNWVDVASLPGELVINSGDMLREISAGYYPSTTHRVLNPGAEIANESRISIPFFLTPRLDIRLSDRYTAGSYLDERLKLITRNTKDLEVKNP